MLSYRGTPTWFITFAPADARHPLAMYFVGDKLDWGYDRLTKNEQFRRIATNPVAAARFFHLMVETFINAILRAGQSKPGIFGRVSDYFGTVEQQGRLTLHIHLLLWIDRSLSPQEICDKIRSNDKVFMM